MVKKAVGFIIRAGNRPVSFVPGPGSGVWTWQADVRTHAVLHLFTNGLQW